VHPAVQGENAINYSHLLRPWVAAAQLFPHPHRLQIGLQFPLFATVLPVCN